MECPRCGSTAFSLNISCPDCQFSGEIEALEQLSNLRFLLIEAESWPDLPLSLRNQLQTRYGRQLREVEVELDLRQPPPDQTEAETLRNQLSQRQALLEIMPAWQRQGWLTPALHLQLIEKANAAIDDIRERLVDAPKAQPSSHSELRLRQLERKRFLLETMKELLATEKITAAIYLSATSQLNDEIADLEIQAGLRKRPQPATEEQVAPSEKRPQIKPKKEKPPRRPWTWDRVWETLLSERTLQAILFLGALLIFAAGVSWVAWNWGAFPPIVQVAFLGGFTALFYALGWYVRARLQLRGSGIALSAVGALLVPLDFYAFYLSGGFPPDAWPAVWLGGSFVCLLIYLGATYLIQAEFFGYLAVTATGSLVVASLNFFHVDTAWWPTGMAALALALALLSEGLAGSRHLDQWRILGPPISRMALLGVVSVMALAMGWGLLRGMDRTFTLALAIDWWLGGATLGVKVHRYRLRALVWGAAGAFPIAVGLTERWFYYSGNVATAWYAFGLALLAPIYLIIGHQLSRPKREPRYGRIIIIVGGLLTAVSALWSLGDAAAAGLVHPLLAITMILAARLWRQPRWLSLASLFLLSGSAAWQGGRGATIAELSLPWALLSILFVAAAIRFRSASIRFDAPLYGAGLAIAGLAILPPLFLFNQSLLAYALANWIGVNGWLAYLAHGRDTPGLQMMLSGRRLRPLGATLFHWSAALGLLPWLWLTWTNNRPAAAPLAMVYAVMVWGLLWLCVRLRRLWWRYGRPWQSAAHLFNLMAIILGLVYDEPGWLAGVLLLTAVFYFAAAWILHGPAWLYLGGLLFPAGLLLALDWIGWPEKTLTAVLALIFFSYMLAALWLKRKGARPAYVAPLSNLVILIGGMHALLNVLFYLTWPEADSIWVAAAYGLLGLSFGLVAWLQSESFYGHIGIWLMTGAGGLVVKLYSRGSGRSAVFGALAAIIFILAERSLHHLAIGGRLPLPARWRISCGQVLADRFIILFIRRAWRLYRWPLRFAGWMVSLATIGWALIRNLVWLGGGVTRETWSVVALLLVTALYGLSARLFQRPRFVTLASLLLFVPWTLLTHLGWFVAPAPRWEVYGLSWAILALLLLVVGILLALRLGLGRWSWPPQIVAHGLLVLALIWSADDVVASSVTMGLAVLFYSTAVWIDRYFQVKWNSVRFLYPAVFFIPVWAVYLLWRFVPTASATTTGLLLLLFPLPALALGRRWARWEPAYRWPLYLLAYGSAIVATLQMVEARPFLIGVLLFDVALAVLSVWIFREPQWWYPATLLLPAALALLMVEVRLDEVRYIGWMFIGLSAVYLMGAQQLTRQKLARYAPPLLVMTFMLAATGLLPSSENREGALVGFSMAAIVYTLIAVWKRWPLVLYVVMGMGCIAYGAALTMLDIASDYWGLALWPGIGTLLVLAIALDERWGLEPEASSDRLPPFSLRNTNEWTTAVSQRIWRWWALPLYLTAFGGAALSGLLAIGGDWQWFTALGLGTAVYAWALFRFRQRGWLLLAWWWGQWTALALIRWLGLTDSPTQVALAFLPVTVATAVGGLLLERRLGEGPPFSQEKSQVWSGWSRPLYLLLLFNLGFGQLMALSASGEGMTITLVHALILAALATVWIWPPLTYPPLLLTFVALFQFMEWRAAPETSWPPALAALALLYGLIGYGWPYLRRLGYATFSRVEIWGRPFRFGGWGSSTIALLLTFVLGVNVPALALRAALGMLAIRPSELPQVQMMILTLAILGLFYLLVALAERRPRIGYGALLLLLGAWSLWLLLIARQTNLQLYALPAGLYLLGVGWLEWQTGLRRLARWIDRAGLLLLFGSVFWQSFGEQGGWYALLMIGEGLLVVWLGSWRRLRRLLYAGVAAVVIAVAGQLIEPLLALNTFVLLLLGALLVALGIGLERRLETVRELSMDLRNRLEHWE